MKRLIVTADDVGLHEGMTLGAIRAHRDGIVTACSVAGAGTALAHAAEHLKDCPGLDVGVHLMLVEAGRFARDYRGFVARYMLGRVSMQEVERELRLQIERVLGYGLRPCHLNGHQHLHVLPRVFPIVVRLALEYGVPYIRIPDDRMPANVPLARRGAVGALGALARRAARTAHGAGLFTNDTAIGIANAGHLTAARLITLAGQVNGVTELVTHPGLDGPGLARAYGWRYEWDRETEALCDPEVRACLAREGIERVGVRAVAMPAGGGCLRSSCRCDSPADRG